MSGTSGSYKKPQGKSHCRLGVRKNKRIALKKFSIGTRERGGGQLGEWERELWRKKIFSEVGVSLECVCSSGHGQACSTNNDTRVKVRSDTGLETCEDTQELTPLTLVSCPFNTGNI